MPAEHSNPDLTDEQLENAIRAHSISLSACPGCGAIHVFHYDEEGNVISMIQLTATAWLDMVEPIDDVLIEALEKLEEERPEGTLQ